MKTNYLVATIREWNIEQFHQHNESLPGTWSLISSPEELTLERLREINPRYIFFPHWSWIVSDEILNEFDCVCFHMTDLPYGRGGSPLQNLIERGHKDTKLTALKMSKQLDAGDIFFKKPLKLTGSATDIYRRAARVTFQMIREIVEKEPEPTRQQGDAVVFSRRKPEQSELPKGVSLQSIYNHIRMLDAPGYPKAFIEYGDYIIEFDNAALDDSGSLTANITMSKNLAEN